jgi:hypothetical protein
MFEMFWINTCHITGIPIRRQDLKRVLSDNLTIRIYDALTY